MIDRARRLADRVTDARWTTAPPGSGWSMSQCVMHLALLCAAGWTGDECQALVDLNRAKGGCLNRPLSRVPCEAGNVDARALPIACPPFYFFTNAGQLSTTLIDDRAAG